MTPGVALSSRCASDVRCQQILARRHREDCDTELSGDCPRGSSLPHAVRGTEHRKLISGDQRRIPAVDRHLGRVACRVAVGKLRKASDARRRVVPPRGPSTVARSRCCGRWRVTGTPSLVTAVIILPFAFSSPRVHNRGFLFIRLPYRPRAMADASGDTIVHLVIAITLFQGDQARGRRYHPSWVIYPFVLVRKTVVLPSGSGRERDGRRA
jgi:hypothetical protein